MGKFAWVTLATNDSYAMGALVVAHSLRRVNTAHQLVVLITPGVTEAMKTQLSAVFNVVKLVDVLDSRDADNLALLARPELGITFTKLHCWKLTEYEKCVFLDADTLVLQNSDELFEREELSAAPDAGWPDCFNSGVFVYKPSPQTFQALIEFALVHGSFDGGDQGLLNLFFSDWATKDIQKHLPFVYNMCSTATYSYLPAFKQFGAGLKIIHFIGAAKPWLQPFNTETGLVSVSGESQHLAQFVQMWWDIFCSHVHPTLSSEMAGLAGALATVTLGAPISVEQRALEEHLRRQGWEQGQIDYMGKDSFANIWQKICETLGTTAPVAPPEDAPAPVAPVAAPVYVSSVEISPSGQIDKTPPQASYAPVSALKPTVEASDIKDATKAPLSETTTVAPEPKPLVTEVVSTEASVSPSATLETSTPTPQIASEPPAAKQPDTPVESAEKTETPVASSEAPVTPAIPTTITSAPKEALATVPTSTETPVAAPAAAETPASSPPAPTPIELPVQTTPAPTPTPTEVPATPAPIPKEVPLPTPPALTPTEIPVSTTPAPIPSEVPLSTPPVSAPTEVPLPTPPVPTPTEVPLPTPPVPTPTEVTVPKSPAPTPTEEPVPTTPTPTPTEVPVPTTTAPIPVEPPVPKSPTEVPVPSTPTPVPTEAPVPSTPTPVPTEAPVPSTPTPVPTEVLSTPTPVPTEAPVPTTPAPSEVPISTPTPTETPVSSPPAATPAQTPSSTPSAPVPTETAPPIPPVSPASAPIPTEATENVPTPTSESIAPATKAEPAQPQTPTVTEPTPPTSPPIAAETLQLTKLQVEADVPGTPPVGGSTQPSLEGAVADEPPVPPKRKGGSKAPQDSKNHKGGKPSKGKK